MADPIIELGRGQILLGNYLVDAYDVEMTPHSADYEYFESYEGIISIRKQLDIHTELKFKVLLSEQSVEDYRYNPDDVTDLQEYREKYVEERKSFLDDIDGEVVLVASQMFKPFKGVVSARSYKIAGGETDTEYDITMKEVE